MREGGESFDSLFRRFRKSVQREKLLTYVRRRRYYEKPSQIRKRQAAKKRVKSRRTTMKALRRR
jgi:small subunit ribosomal protein S21